MCYYSSNLKVTIAFFLWLCCGGISYGQALQNIFNGYVITLQNDTLRGELDVVSPINAQLPRSIGFRKKTDYNFKKYYEASELKEVYLNSSKTQETLIFHCRMVSINFSERLARQFNPNLPNIRKDTSLFLRAYVLGKANLYYFEDASGSPYYMVEKKGQKMAVLIDEIKNVSDKTTEKPLDFRNQLYQLMKDCRAFDKKTFDKLTLSTNDLVQLTRTYNTKMPSERPIFVAEQTRGTQAYGLMLGVQHSIVRQNTWTHQTSNWPPSVGAWFSLDINKKIPLKLFCELEYTTFQTQADRHRSITVLHYYDSLSLKSNYIRANFSLAYLHSLSKSTQLYGKFGTSFGVSVKNTIQQVAYSYDELLLKTTNLEKLHPRSFDIACHSAMGIQHKKMSLELRYRLSNGYSSAEMIRTAVHSFSLNLTWDFAVNKMIIKSQIK